MNTTTAITLSIQAKGEIIASNFDLYASMIRTWLGEINTSLTTDEEFGQAVLDVKGLSEKEAELKTCKEAILAQAEQFYSAFKEIDTLDGEMSAKRLSLSKLIDTEREKRKRELVEESLATFTMIDPALARKTYLNSLELALKGKRTLETMKTALRIYATTQHAGIAKTALVLDRYEKVYGADSLPDRRELSVQSAEAVEAELRRRIDLRRANEDKAKAEREAADARAAAAKAQAQLAEANKPPPPPAVIPVSKPQATAQPEDDSLFAAPVAQAVAPAADPIPADGDDDGVREWQVFASMVFQQFAPLKAHRENLTNLENRRAAKEFAEAVNAAATNAGLVAAYQAWKETNQ